MKLCAICTGGLLGFGAMAAGSRLAAQQDTVRLPTITVTATRVPVEHRSVTASLTVLQGDDLRRRGILSVADALRLVPGALTVQPGSFGGTTSLFLRGGESDYVQVLIDGIPVNDPGGAYDFAYLSTTNVDRIEVLRGPGSVLYGSDGVTGVINVITRDGSGPARVSGGVQGGSYGSLAIDADLVGGTTELGYAFGLHRFSSAGAYAFNNDFDNTVVSGRFRLRPDQRTTVGLSLRYRDSRYAFPTDATGLAVDRNAASLNETTTVGIEITRALHETLDASVQINSNVGAGGTDDAQDNPSDTLGFYAFQSLQDLSRQSVDARLDYRPAAGLIVTAGIQAELQKERSFNESQSAFGPSSGTSANERSNRGYYAQMLAEGSGASVVAGVRTDVNDAFGTFHTYRLGGRYGLNGGPAIRASIGRSFKAPTFFENYATGFVLGNPDLEPERSRTWEVGLEQDFGEDRVRLRATWFDQRFRNLIQFTFANTPNYQNVAEADAAGLELEVTSHPAAGVTVFANATRLWTEVVDAGFDTGTGAAFVEGSRLLRRPDLIVNIGVDAVLSDRVSAGVIGHHVGGRDDLDFSTFPSTRVELGSVTTIDVSAQVRLMERGETGVVLTASVTNMFDRQFETVRGFPGRRRVILAGFRVER